MYTYVYIYILYSYSNSNSYIIYTYNHIYRYTSIWSFYGPPIQWDSRSCVLFQLLLSCWREMRNRRPPVSQRQGANRQFEFRPEPPQDHHRTTAPEKNRKVNCFQGAAGPLTVPTWSHGVFRHGNINRSMFMLTSHSAKLSAEWSNSQLLRFLSSRHVNTSGVMNQLTCHRMQREPNGDHIDSLSHWTEPDRTW